MVLGIALGTAGLIVILCAGDSIEKELMENLELVGGATVIRLLWNDLDCAHPAEFTSRDLGQLRCVDHVTAVAPIVRVHRVGARYKINRWVPGIVGVSPSYLRMTYSSLAGGRLINERDVEERGNVCVLGPDVVERLFAGNDPMGQRCTIAGTTFTVIGMLGGVEMRNTAHEILIPISTAADLFPGARSVKEVMVRIDHVTNVETVRNQCQEILGKNHAECVDCLRVMYFRERVKKVKAVLTNFSILLRAGLVAGLLLGGIGIIRVMLAAVKDRTKEIGLKKVLGARDRTIFLQFLVEALLIGFFGTLFGTLLSGAAVNLIERGLSVRITFLEALPYLGAGVIFGSLLGVCSGVLPALRASRMDPAEAMRFE